MGERHGRKRGLALSWALLTAVLAPWIEVTAARALETRTVSDLRRLIPTILSERSDREALWSREAERPGFRLRVVDFEMVGTSDDLTLSAGWSWFNPHRLQVFAGFGAKFPDPRSESSMAEAEPAGSPVSLVVGPWAGTGATWVPTPDLRLALEARWSPADVTLPERDENLTQFRTGVSLTLSW